MTTFGLITEGITDQLVLENVLLGWFADQRGDIGLEPVFNAVQPQRDTTGSHGQHPPAGWTLVKSYLGSGEHRRALQTNDYLVIQIDTDVCEEAGFDVPRT